MKQELQELISLTELFIYENYSVAKVKPAAPIIASADPLPQKMPVVKETSVPIKKEEASLAQPEKPKKIERDFSDIERVFAKDLPHIKVLKDWPVEKEITFTSYILFYNETEQELRFLQNVANHIGFRFGPAALLKANQFKDSSVKFLLASKETLEMFPNIQEAKTPICIFDKVSEYFKNPLSKALLWKAISKLCL